MKRSIGRLAAPLVGALVVGVGIWAAVTHFESRTIQAQTTYAKDKGYFYRLKASFEIKGNGERVDFDYVVACNIRLTRWKDGGLSNDSTFSPRVMVMPTASGQAVMLKTLNECSGLTSENGDVPPDILPIAIWFDSVEDLSNGVGYVSEDAYDNPLGKLMFHGARIDRATRADWEAWRKRAADEYAERGALPGPWGYDYPDNLNINNPDGAKYVAGCDGYRRLKLPANMREKFRALWPQEHPRFWALPNQDDSKISGLISDPKQPSPPSLGPWGSRFGAPGDSAANGASLRSGRQVGRGHHIPTRWPTETYPFLWRSVSSALPLIATPPTSPSDVYVQKLDFRDGALNGFAACQNRWNLSGLAIEEVDPGWKKTKRHVFMVDDQVVRVGHGESIRLLQPTFMQERDDYVFISFAFGL
jgi:hypothetical protein